MDSGCGGGGGGGIAALSAAAAAAAAVASAAVAAAAVAAAGAAAAAAALSVDVEGRWDATAVSTQSSISTPCFFKLVMKKVSCSSHPGLRVLESTEWV